MNTQNYSQELVGKNSTFQTRTNIKTASKLQKHKKKHSLCLICTKGNICICVCVYLYIYVDKTKHRIQKSDSSDSGSSSQQTGFTSGFTPQILSYFLSLLFNNVRENFVSSFFFFFEWLFLLLTQIFYFSFLFIFHPLIKHRVKDEYSSTFFITSLTM